MATITNRLQLVNKERLLCAVLYLRTKLLRSRNLAILLGLASVISIIITYSEIVGSNNPFGVGKSSVTQWVVIDLVLLLFLAVVVSRKLFLLMYEHRKGVLGSNLQTRIVIMFSLVAMVPTIVMVIASAFFFNYGIQSWFNQKVSSAIDGSVEVARAYLDEHKNIIRADIIGMASDINRDAISIRRNPRLFSQKLEFLAVIRKIPEAIVFQKTTYGNINILATTSLSLSLQLEIEDLSKEIIAKAEKGELITLTSDTDDRVISLIKLDNFFDTYLLVGRFVDNRVINYIESTEGAATEYNQLKNNISSLQIKFFVIFVTIALLLLFVTAWVGFLFASYLVRPISSLLEVTEKVKDGDFSVRVKEEILNDEMAILAKAFNRMTEQVEKQRKELISAQRRSAWADIARRIAHEIKNPLTPIQLATERLKRKYIEQVDDKDNFEKYINTITRNASTIGGMVDEFASFARIPMPVFASNNLCELVEEVIFARDGISSQISFEKKLPKNPIILNCDAGQITQILTNIIKNAEESILEKMANDKKFTKGLIKIKLAKIANKCVIAIKDNGKGFSSEIKDRITEPYVTTKSKGTGLGLAIVKKIVEDHLGTIEFKNINSGACVYLSFPIQQK